MKRRRLCILFGLSVIVCCAIVFGPLPTVLYFPLLRPPLGKASGYEFGVRSFSFSPGLSPSILRLPFSNVSAHSLARLASNITPKNSFDLILRGEIDNLVLRDLKLTYRIGETPGGNTDLSFVEKLPTIRRLEVQNAEVLVTFEGGPQQVELTDLNLVVKDFSSKTGGSIAFRANFAATAPGDTAIAASGRIKADFELTGVHPKPYGKGTVELVVDSTRYTSGNRTASLSGLTLAADLTYDQQTETVAINTLRGESKDFGTIGGGAQVLLRGDLPWSASLSAASIDFARAFATIQPLLPDGYRAWAVQGQGTVETQAEGRFVEGRPSFDGVVVFSFTQGGVGSPSDS